MIDTGNLERQHQDFFALMDKISIHKSEGQVKAHASAIALLLNQLSGKLKIHAISEDKFLYPSLMNHSNSSVKTISQNFYAEMGGLAQVFEEFKSNFATTNKISANPAAFLSESQKVFTALQRRVNKENTELYPLAAL
ncbi:hemerythrin domain-containing protein [Pelosinus propionicus]|uniref:Hemerythrin HHE cation binding domain-containing protein n=1 Tax=Pelosinus propionicus DSM 13327 TaxID=1123291 RepID=A0A1I4L4J9_9FIRM|nr:hemerythrin domain-containing protein [Pelosinus propionicus]SFL85932.1 Hemerythrin HHE cation binding domain-containing protein [Pelosinus propionicus DSM 13327]